jgi:opacity protein-like surface antigen
MKKLLSSALIIASVAAPFSSASAQRLIPPTFSFGGFVGASLPLGDFKNESNSGLLAGAFAAKSLSTNVRVRVDGTYNDFGNKNFTIQDGTGSHQSRLVSGTLDIEYNIGADPTMETGAGIFPYISGGFGIYHFSFDDSCTGSGCSEFILGSYTETDQGFNAGVGAIIPLSGFTPFVNAQYHTIFSSLDNGQGIHLNVLQLSFGLRF